MAQPHLEHERHEIGHAARAQPGNHIARDAHAEGVDAKNAQADQGSLVAPGVPGVQRQKRHTGEQQKGSQAF